MTSFWPLANTSPWTSSLRHTGGEGVNNYVSWGAGIAQWLERRTGDRKVSGSSPGRSSGKILFSKVNFLCRLLFRHPFHPRATAVARERSRSFCQRCRWQVTAKHACTLGMWLCMKRHCKLEHGCTLNAPRWQQFHVAPAT